jgi:hypothetical protein
MSKPAIVMVQSFSYRDQPEEFSNKYHFAGPAPGDDASWLALANSLRTALTPCFTSGVTFHRAYGYTDGDNPSVWGHDWEIPGPPPVGSMPTPSDGYQPPGDTAAFIRWPTAKRNSRGKMVYARKYFHSVYGLSGDHDHVSYTQAVLLDAFAAKCIDGSISSVFHLCLPDGTPAQSGGTQPWLTTRTLKRRGKRPPT